MRAKVPTSVLSTVKPRNEYVLVKRDAREKASKGGILLPDQAQHSQQLGTVVSVGPGKMEFGARLGIDLEVGTRVIFQAYAGTEFLSEDGSEDEYVILKEGDVLAVLP